MAPSSAVHRPRAITVRVSDSERSAIANAAEARGLSLSEHLRTLGQEAAGGISRAGTEPATAEAEVSEVGNPHRPEAGSNRGWPKGITTPPPSNSDAATPAPDPPAAGSVVQPEGSGDNTDRDAWMKQRVVQLKARGMTTPVARRAAAREWERRR